MIFTQAAIEGIKSGRVTLALRRWNTVGIKPGSLIRSSLGVIEIVSMEEVAEFADIDAIAAGFKDASEATRIVDKLSRGGQRYRIGVRYAGDDPPPRAPGAHPTRRRRGGRHPTPSDADGS